MGRLIESLDPKSDPDIQRAWADEIAGRVAGLNAGIVETIPWERVRNEMFGQRDED